MFRGTGPFGAATRPGSGVVHRAPRPLPTESFAGRRRLRNGSPPWAQRSLLAADRLVFSRRSRAARVIALVGLVALCSSYVAPVATAAAATHGDAVGAARPRGARDRLPGVRGERRRRLRRLRTSPTSGCTEVEAPREAAPRGAERR